MSLPVDEPGRQDIRHALRENLFVDAGAGTGKTRELVQRIRNLILEGHANVQQIAAITFTEAAATELRGRVRQELEKSALEGDPHGRCSAALRDFDQGVFSTLHAFAQRILQEHSLEAGLPPELEVTTEIESATEFNRRWDDLLADLYGGQEAEPLVRRAYDLGLTLTSLEQFARLLHENHDRAEAMSASPPLPDPDVGALTSKLREARDLAPNCRAPEDKLLRHLVAVVSPMVDELTAATSPDDVVRVLAATASVKANNGRAGSWSGRKQDVVDALRAADELLSEALAIQQDAVVRGIVAKVATFVLDWAGSRRQTGRLHFHDLLVLCLRLLRQRPEIRGRLRGRFTHLLLDEFQDTDPLQIEIAVLLASEGDGAAPWHQAELAPARLFLVGDPKQSIYRFRRADIAVYERAKTQLRSVPVELSQNFRSVPGILAWVNAVFAHTIGTGEPSAQPAYTPLHAERSPVDQRPAVHRFGGAVDSRAGEIRVLEAQDVARVVRRVLDERWQVQPPRGQALRDARPSDIAILVRRHATVRLLERTLEDAHVPYRLESKSLIWATDEVRDLVTILQAIDDQADEVATVAALRHPAFGCSDLALLDWHAAGGRWQAWTDVPPGMEGSPVARGMARLQRLHQTRWSFSVGGLVEHVIRELHLLELAFAHRRPRDRWRRLRFLADQAHAHHQAGGNLRAFLRWAEYQAEQDIRVDEFLAPEPDDEAVRISTIHGAKGLEYPIVVLLGLDADTGRLPGQPRLLWGEQGEPAVMLAASLKTRDYDAVRDREVAMHGHEERRLFYVGATRARDHLVVSLHHKARGKSNAAALANVPKLGPLWAELELPAGGPATPIAAPPVNGFTTATPADRLAWSDERAALLAAATRPKIFAATTIAQGLAKSLPGSAPGGEPADTDDAPPSRKGRGGTSIGRAVHAVLQTIDLTEPTDLDDIARAQAALEGVPGEGEQVAKLARTALRSDAVQAALASGRYWRELHVGAPLEGVTVEGFIDLLYAEGDDLVVVDYKTDSISGSAAAAEAAARYRPQAATYALALEATLPQQVARCVFVFTRSPAAIEVSISGSDLIEAKAEVRAALRLGGTLSTRSVEALDFDAAFRARQLSPSRSAASSHAEGLDERPA